MKRGVFMCMCCERARTIVLLLLCLRFEPRLAVSAVACPVAVLLDLAVCHYVLSIHYKCLDLLQIDLIMSPCDPLFVCRGNWGQCETLSIRCSIALSDSF